MPEQLLARDIKEVSKLKKKKAMHIFNILDKTKQGLKQQLETQKTSQANEIEKRLEEDVAQGVKEEFIPIRRAQHEKAAYLKNMDLRYYKEAKGEGEKKEPELAIYSKEGVKHLIKDAIVDAYTSGNKEALATYARFAIDINGLKAVNDLAGHEVGDKFLKRVVEVLTKIKESLLEKDGGLGLDQVEISHEGGDEFGIFVKSGKPLEPEIVQAMHEYITKELQFDASKFLTNEIIIAKGQMEELPPIDKEGNPYKFHASAGVGVSTFKEVLINPGTKEELEIRMEEMAKSKSKKEGVLTPEELAEAVKELTNEDIKNLLMGMVLDETDERMIENKKEGKSQLIDFERKLLLRNEEMKLMTDRLVFLSEAMTDKDRQIKSLQKIRDELTVNHQSCLEDVGNLTKQLIAEKTSK